MKSVSECTGTVGGGGFGVTLCARNKWRARDFARGEEEEEEEETGRTDGSGIQAVISCLLHTFESTSPSWREEEEERAKKNLLLLELLLLLLLLQQCKHGTGVGPQTKSGSRSRSFRDKNKDQCPPCCHECRLHGLGQ